MLRFVYGLLAVAVAMLASGEVLGQTNYYWNGSGAVTSTASWGQNLDGSGTAPANFTTSNQLFNIQSGQSAVQNANWTISGTSSRLVVQSGGTFQSNAFTTAYTVNLNSSSTFIFNGTAVGALSAGTINSSSVFRVANSGFTGTIDTFGTFGNIEVQRGTGSLTLGIITTLGDVRAIEGEMRISSGSTVARTWTVGADVEVSSGATWNLNNGTSSATATANISGTVTNLGTISKTGSASATINFVGSATSDVTWGTINAANAATFTVSSTRDLTFLDSFSNTGAGTLTLTNNGIIRLGNGGATGAIGGTVTNNGQIFFNRTADLTQGGIISGSGSITKQNTNSLTLDKANTFSNGTTVSAGTLNLTNTTGSATGSGIVTVDGGTLRGTGTASGATTINSGGTVQGGSTTNQVGTLNFGNNLTVVGGGTISVRIADASTAGTLNGGQSSITGANNRLTVIGTLDVNSLANIVVDGTGATFGGGNTYSYLIASGGTVNAVDITDSARFTFNNFNVGVDTTTIRLQNDAGNLYLNFTTVPEPSLIFGLSVGLVAVAGVIRKRLR